MNKNKPNRRVLLKLSGEVLGGNSKFGLDPSVLKRLATEIQQVINQGYQIAIVLGGGNLFRGHSLSSIGIERVTGDQMGMLATVMNGLALCDALKDIGVETKVMSSVFILGITDFYNHHTAIDDLNSGRVVILTGGTGNPYFTTDTNACLRGIEIKANIMLKATKVDGVYDKNPDKYPDAKKFDKISYNEILDRQLGVMDLTAICLSRDSNLNIRVFNLNKPNNILKALVYEEGTLISNSA